MKIILMCLLLFITACSSTDVTKPTRPEHAPKDYKPKGMVKYNNEGLDYLKASRKEDAFKRMSENCNGKYKVTEEGPMGETGISHGTATGGSVWGTSQYWYIGYECLD